MNKKAHNCSCAVGVVKIFAEMGKIVLASDSLSMNAVGSDTHREGQYLVAVEAIVVFVALSILPALAYFARKVWNL